MYCLLWLGFIGISFPCDAADQGRSSQSLREIVTKLRRYEVTLGESTDVPPAISQNLTILKHAVRDLIVEVTGAKDTIETNPEVLTQRVIEELERQDIPVGDEYRGYGAIEKIELRCPKEYPNWMIATTSLSIPYGSDVSLYLFETNGSSWKHVMTVESNGYKTIHAAQGSLSYWISPPKSGTKPYIVTAEVSPSAWSVWQALRLKVLRVGAQPDSPFVLATRTLTYNILESYFLSIHNAGFGVIYLGFPINAELAGWQGVYYTEYTVSEKKASVVRNLAVDPYNIMKKWTAKNWTIASRSVAPSDRNTVQQWHQRFQKSTWACGLGHIHLDQDLDGNHEKLLAEVSCEKDNAESPSAYVLLTPGQHGFEIVSISEKSQLTNEPEGYTVYFGGKPGITDPIPLSIIHPKLPSSIHATTANRVTLQLSIVVNEDGFVGSVSILHWPADLPGIVVPAIQAVKKWKFKPGIVNGKPEKVSIKTEVVFEQ
jgi:hypothetical protein